MKKILFTLFLLLPMVAVDSSAYTLKRVSVHDPSIVWEPSSNYYYIFGSHRAAARSKDLMNWASLQAPWGTVNAQGNVGSGVANSKAFLTNMKGARSTITSLVN